MDVENRQQCQHLAELHHRPGPSLTLRAQEQALERWERRMNPQGVEFNPSRAGRRA